MDGTVVGIDVSKAQLDVHVLPSNEALSARRRQREALSTASTPTTLIGMDGRVRPGHDGGGED